MPTPSSRISRALSKMLQAMPRAWRDSAKARPPMPPPTIATCTELFRPDVRGFHELRPARRLACHPLPELRRRAHQDLHALGGEGGAHFGRRERAIHVGVDASHD